MYITIQETSLYCQYIYKRNTKECIYREIYKPSGGKRKEKEVYCYIYIEKHYIEKRDVLYIYIGKYKIIQAKEIYCISYIQEKYKNPLGKKRYISIYIGKT